MQTKPSYSETGPSLRNNYLYLRAVVPEDYPYLYLVETSSSMAARWGLRGATPAYQEWIQQRSAGVLAQFMVIDANGDSRIGLVTVFSADFQDAHAHLAALSFDPDGNSVMMMLGLGLFVDYVFKCWNLRKLYLDTAEYNYAQFASGAGKFFEIEGRLKGHHYFDGKWWDHLILAIFREQWPETSQLIDQAGNWRAE
jgi:hypothetical protein